jgi:hypothetical protein
LGFTVRLPSSGRGDGFERKDSRGARI